MWSKLLFIALFGLFLAAKFEVNDAVVFRFTNFVCESYNKSWFVFHNCRLKAVSRSKVLLNMNGTVLHPVNNATLHAQIFKKANGFKPWLLDGTVDVCRFLKKGYNPFIQIVFNLFKEFSNINHTCPFVGPQIVKDFYLQPELLRLPFPTGDYMLSLQWLFHNKPQFDTNVSFSYVEDLLKRNN
ncbi:uncharacterized protein LOC117898832 [Drosophila subobscura]|uniref:uncharacterized protein LOC117898832 n=1 Tax=Drosophila subobscura TaxID=7241 RepID=UPI00155A6333|nr:uncharacterized protein LOC117898832 [Drosophila subobscura]